jgi:hypothetical protein
MASKIQLVHNWWCSLSSVADLDPNPDLDPLDPRVFGLLDPDHRYPEPDPDPSNIKQNSKKIRKPFSVSYSRS